MDEPANDHAEVVGLPPVVYAVPLGVGLLLNLLLPVRILPPRTAKVLGFVATGAGVALGLAAVTQLRRAGTAIHPHHPTTTVVPHGPYRFSRNPIYLSLTLVYAGAGLLANALWPFLLLPGAVNVIRHGVIEPEEQYLENRFGQTYLDYTARVRRWI